MKKFISVLIVFLMVLSLIGCNGTDEVSVESNSPDNQAQNNKKTDANDANVAGAGDEYDDTIIFGFDADATTLDPARAHEGYMTMSSAPMIYSQLVKLDDKNQVVGDLATEWSVSDDKLMWTFKLRNDVYFHDGKHLTSKDVKATFDRLLDKSNGFATTSIINMISEVKAPDDYTVEFVTGFPCSILPSLFTKGFCGIADEEYFNKYGLSFGMEVESINGSGPFKLVSWNMDEQMVFVRNDEYYGDKALTKNIVFKPIPDASARVIALENGEVDIINNVPTDDIERLQNISTLQVITKPTTVQRAFRFGCNDPIISNPKVRQAIIYGIDKTAIVEALYKGMAIPSTCPLTEVIPFYKDLGTIERDVEKSKKLLEEAGYPNGFDTKMIATTNYYKTSEAAEIMASQLAEVGINVQIEVVEGSTHIAKRAGLTPEEFDWPMFAMGIGTASGDADGMFRGIFTTTETGTNIRNYGFYSNSEVDKLVLEGLEETDYDKREVIYNRICEIMYLEDPAAIYLYDNLVVLGASNKLKDPTIFPAGYFTMEKATLKK